MLLSELLSLCRREMEGQCPRGSPEPELLVSHLAGIPRSRLFLEGEREVGDLVGALRSLIRRRVSGEPVQYILGSWEFYGRAFHLTRDTLIPRPETEGLVEMVVDTWRRETRGIGRMLDVGTGCGAIAVTLAAELPKTEVLAVDVSREALTVARENARRLGVADRVLFFRADGYSALKRGDRFDVVVSNPPYVSEMEWKSLPWDVRGFEPAGALLAGPDGLAMIRPLVADAGEYLKPGGGLWLEIGESQGEDVRRLPCGPLRFGGVKKDLAGRDRVARWILPASGNRYRERDE
jgi:release factor glutamine methyltransferase